MNVNCSCSAHIHLGLHQEAALPDTNVTGNCLSKPTIASTTEQERGILEGYDTNGAILFVVGLLLMYGLGMFLLILSLVQKSRSELEGMQVIDHLRDLEEMRKAERKKRSSGHYSVRSQNSQTADSPKLPARPLTEPGGPSDEDINIQSSSSSSNASTDDAVLEVFV